LMMIATVAVAAVAISKSSQSSTIIYSAATSNKNSDAYKIK